MERAEELVKNRLQRYDLEPSEKLGQHFLVDDQAINVISASVIPGAKVIEVGSGIGHFTQALAQRASEVLGIEIDRKFEGVLQDLSERQPNIGFVMTDVLNFNLGSVIKDGQITQVIANLPFHITEPFLSKLIDLPIESAILLLGDSAAKEFMASPRDPNYGKMSLIAQTFFNVREIAVIDKSGFYPQPRTDAIVVELTPKEKREIEVNPSNFVFATLIRKSDKGELVINVMKQGIVDVSLAANRGTLSKRESNRKDRADTRRHLKDLAHKYNCGGRLENHTGGGQRGDRILSQVDALTKLYKMEIDRDVLTKPFFALNNQELRQLVQEAEKVLN